ncbi:prenyltransferase/squalene oxidase repeat-containing protein [Streptomyces sp. URMC 123]|uniref:prenyltransferase/squalene oxidase repeat-containing protein n=1 Tax=Streptomyces sp. URMC 123 TaxID=3423403 RepID=UPI003F1B1348
MNVRRSAAVLAATAVLCAAAAPAASAAIADDAPSAKPSAPASLPSGLYGTKDPQFDGVWRQSVALIAQRAVGVTPAPKAVDWLAGQQCESGGFAAYRPDPAEKCGSATRLDSNATAQAVQALAAVGGHAEGVKKAVGWLKTTQNQDGGWGSAPGDPSDANSTSVVIGALAAAQEDPAKAVSQQGKSPYDALTGFQLGCDAPEDRRGAFAWQPQDGKLEANDGATVDAALAALGKGLAVDPLPRGGADVPVRPMECGEGVADKPADKPADPKRAADAAAGYLSAVLAKNGGHVKGLALGGATPPPDPGNTADAVLALAAGGHREALRAPLTWLENNSAAWAKEQGPAAYGALVLAARAAGADPRNFGGTDLVAQLNATGPAPQAGADAPAKDAKDAKDEKAEDEGSGFGVWWIVGAFLVAGVGIGFLLSGRGKR